MRRSRRRTRRNRPYLPLTGFPTSKIVRFRYVIETAFDAATNTIDVAPFKANSIYQPFGGIAADHPPMGAVEWSTIYNHVTVIGSKCKVRFFNTTTSNVIPSYCGIMLADANNTLSTSSVNELLEGKFRTDKINFAGIVNNGAGPATTGMYQSVSTFSAKKFFGIGAISGLNPYRGTFVSDPSETAYFLVFSASANGSNPGVISAMIEIQYICLLHEPKLIPIAAPYNP